jgi:hypothetical protein
MTSSSTSTLGASATRRVVEQLRFARASDDPPGTAQLGGWFVGEVERSLMRRRPR